MTKVIGLLSPVIVPLVIAGILFFSAERNNRPKLFLALYMLLIAFVFTANAFYFEHNYRVYSWFHSLHIGTVLAIYPGAYIYIKMLVGPSSDHRRLLYHFIPPLLFTLTSAIIFFLLLDIDERTLFLTEYRFSPDFSMRWLKILYYIRMANILFLFAQVFIYMFMIYSILKKYRREVSEIFSNPERFDLNWLRVFNILLALSAFITVFLYTVNPVKLFGDDRFLAYPMLLIAVILWFFGIMGNNQPQLPDSYREENGNGHAPIAGDLAASDLARRLTSYFEEKRPYLDPDLKIWDIASELGSNRTYISRTINSSFNQNFSAFVNSYRVKEAIKLINEDPGKPLKLVAEEVGFGSVSSFSRSFLEVTGKTISRFRSGR